MNEGRPRSLPIPPWPIVWLALGFAAVIRLVARAWFAVAAFVSGRAYERRAVTYPPAEMPTQEEVLAAVAEHELQVANKKGQAGFVVCRCQRHANKPVGFVPAITVSSGETKVEALICIACAEPLYLSDGVMVFGGDA